MAKLKNVEIKSLKVCVGYEGEYYQGNIYLNGKKLGFWSQSSTGAICDDFHFDTCELDKIANEYIVEDTCIKTELFLSELVELIEDEREFKKAVKKGYAGIGIVELNNYNIQIISFPKRINYSDFTDYLLTQGYSEEQLRKANLYFEIKDFEK